MELRILLRMASLSIIFASVMSGCGGSDYQDYSDAPLSDGHDHHDHDHGVHSGVHGGHVLELDDAHGHHAEMVFDKETRDITIYFYGSEIGVAKPASELIFELNVAGDEQVLKAVRSPLEGESEESCSRFVVAGTQIPESITSEAQLDGHFHVTINGKEYVGEFHAHSHGNHGGSDHGHKHEHKE